MENEHRLVHVTSHVTSMVGRVGVVGLCSCGWLAGEEGEDTRLAANRLYEAWEAHARNWSTERPSGGFMERSAATRVAAVPTGPRGGADRPTR